MRFPSTQSPLKERPFTGNTGVFPPFPPPPAFLFRLYFWCCQQGCLLGAFCLLPPGIPIRAQVFYGLVLLGNKEQQQLPLAFPPRVLRGVRLFLDTGVILFLGTDRGNPVKFGGVNP